VDVEVVQPPVSRWKIDYSSVLGVVESFEKDYFLQAVPALDRPSVVSVLRDVARSRGHARALVANVDRLSVELIRVEPGRESTRGSRRESATLLRDIDAELMTSIKAAAIGPVEKVAETLQPWLKPAKVTVQAKPA
jgi:hypothetical protein